MNHKEKQSEFDSLKGSERKLKVCDSLGFPALLHEVGQYII